MSGSHGEVFNTMILYLEKSVKNLGKYEYKIMQKLEKYFLKLDYEVASHVRLNLAWSNIYSDIDMILIKNDEVSIIEIKSNKDRLSNAFKQLEKVKEYVDYVYVATETVPKKWQLNAQHIGLLIVDVNGVREEQKPISMKFIPSSKTLDSFQKKCLKRTLRTKNIEIINQNKDHIVKEIEEKIDPFAMRNYLKQISICGYDCDNNCPIWHFK
jgi:hypothetical protein